MSTRTWPFSVLISSSTRLKGWFVEKELLLRFSYQFIFSHNFFIFFSIFWLSNSSTDRACNCEPDLYRIYREFQWSEVAIVAFMPEQEF